MPRKMADARPTFPLPQRYTQAQTEAVQPPDDRTYSAEVTASSAQSPASSQCTRSKPYTRSIIISLKSLFVKKFFGKNHKVFSVFSVISEILRNDPNPPQIGRAAFATRPYTL